jgi:TatA/E family protein of Tat protein translocase
MFGIGMPELLLLLAIALIVIGPKKLPDLAKSLGRALGEFKKATSELKESMEIDSELRDVKSAFDELNQDIKTSIDTHAPAEDQSPAAPYQYDPPSADDTEHPAEAVEAPPSVDDAAPAPKTTGATPEKSPTEAPKAPKEESSKT